MKIIKASRGSAEQMLDAMKSALSDAGIHASVITSDRTFKDNSGVFGTPGGHVKESELKQYWDENFETDPSLEGYDSYEEWLSDTISVMEEDGSNVTYDKEYVEKLTRGVDDELQSEFDSIKFEEGETSLVVRCTYMGDIEVELDVPYEDLFMTEDKLQQDIWYISNSAVEELENNL